MELNELANAIKNRRSVRKWQDKKVPEELLTQAIELATWAPNGGNRQNWRFYVLLDRQKIEAIADAVQESADKVASWSETPGAGEAARGGGGRASFFRSAPAAIAVAASRYQSAADQAMAARAKVDIEASRMRRWRNIANSRIQSVSSAIAYLLLILHQMGLGTVWMTGPIQAKDKLEKILKIPSGLDVVAFIPVGYPAEETPRGRVRKPVTEVVEVVK